MELYFANTTKQHRSIAYRLPESLKLHYASCNAMGQVLVHKGTEAEVDAIIKQMEPYGVVNVKGIDRAQGFVGGCYSIDKPIRADVIATALEDNDDAMNKVADEERKKTVAAAHVKSNELAQEAGPDAPRINSTTMEYEEQTPAGQDAQTGKQVLEFVEEGVEPKRGRGKRG